MVRSVGRGAHVPVFPSIVAHGGAGGMSWRAVETLPVCLLACSSVCLGVGFWLVALARWLGGCRPSSRLPLAGRLAGSVVVGRSEGGRDGGAVHRRPGRVEKPYEPAGPHLLRGKQLRSQLNSSLLKPSLFKSSPQIPTSTELGHPRFWRTAPLFPCYHRPRPSWCPSLLYPSICRLHIVPILAALSHLPLSSSFALALGDRLDPPSARRCLRLRLRWHL
ncbi:hypothetical protein BGZ61DRAFT_447506, partial [Ilyonectria robusta]|uniref:uncharacterized protein n=1 Tax=Ilyonectria robusta TaxID=1079257 RepID=UPI001E8E1D11